MIRRITVDHAARIYEVTNLFNKFGEDTNDLTEATSCVVCFDKDHWQAVSTDGVPIYTVH